MRNSKSRTLEAILLCGAGYLPRLVQAGLKAMFDSLRPAEHAMLAALLVASVQQDAVPLDDFVAGLKLETDDLSGLRCVLPIAMAMGEWCSYLDEDVLLLG